MAIQTFKEFRKRVEEVIPTANFMEDEDGQIIIYTRLSAEVYSDVGLVVRPFRKED